MDRVLEAQSRLVDPDGVDIPLYPTGEVFGPCVCGSWPGGKCLKCPVIGSRELHNALNMHAFVVKSSLKIGDVNALQFRNGLRPL